MRKRVAAPRTTVTIRMDYDLLRQVDELAYERGWGTRSHVIETAVRRLLESLSQGSGTSQGAGTSAGSGGSEEEEAEEILDELAKEELEHLEEELGVEAR